METPIDSTRITLAISETRRIPIRVLSRGPKQEDNSSRSGPSGRHSTYLKVVIGIERTRPWIARVYMKKEGKHPAPTFCV
jgi:hypothetical protein